MYRKEEWVALDPEEQKRQIERRKTLAGTLMNLVSEITDHEGKILQETDTFLAQEAFYHGYQLLWSSYEEGGLSDKQTVEIRYEEETVFECTYCISDESYHVRKLSEGPRLIEFQTAAEKAIAEREQAAPEENLLEEARELGLIE